MFLATLIGTFLQMSLGNTTLTVEIADTHASRQKGLMGREALLENHGMLFVFPKPEMVGFWMKNTLIPLSIGYFDSEKKLFQIENMDPPKTKELPLCKSIHPAQYALEVPQNWFQEHKISLGEKFTLQVE